MTFIRAVAGGLLAALIAHPACAAINNWTSIGPYGGMVNKIIYNKATPSIVYLLSIGGFSRSTDGGVTWQMVRTDFMNSPNGLAVDPTDPNRLYVVAGNAPFLLTSTDAGKTLTPVPGFPVNLASPGLAQVSADGQTVFVTAGARIVCSTDRGQTWTERATIAPGTLTRVNQFSADPVDSNTLYAVVSLDAGSSGLYVTHDGARTWSQLSLATNPQHVVQDFAIDATDPGTIWAAAFDGLWVSHDRAVTWTRTSFFASNSYASYAVALDPRNPATIYASTPGGLIFRSSDNGATWSNITGNSFSQGIFTLAVNPAHSGTLLIGGASGVWGTTNDGASWSPQVQGLVATYMRQFSASAARDRIYFSDNAGTVGYIAGGADATTPINTDALHQLNAANISADGPGAFGVSSILSAPGANGTLYASLAIGLAMSPDGGNTWSLSQVTQTGTQQIQTMVTWPGLTQTLLAAGNTTAFRSIDAGNLWTTVSAGLPANTTFGTLLAAPSDSTVAYGIPFTLTTNPATYYGLYRTNDSGLTWAHVADTTGDFYLSAIDPHDAQILYGSQNQQLVKSLDGGSSFTVLSNKQGLWTIDPLHTNILYGGSERGLNRSVDGGVSWQDLPVSPAVPTGAWWDAMAVIVDPNRSSDLLVGTARNGIFKMTVAPDLALSLRSSGAVVYGVPFAYEYTAVNNGPYDATGAHISIDIPGNVQNLKISPSDGSCTRTAAIADCTVPILRTGASFDVSMTAVAPTVNSALQISANLSADQPDADGSNNSIVTQATVSDGADLSVTSNSPASAVAGQPVSVTFTVSNSGPGSAAGTSFSYQAGTGVTVNSATASAGSCATTGSGLVTCTLGDLAANKNVSVTITATASAIGTSTSTASVRSISADPLTANGSVTSSTTVIGPAAGGGNSDKGGGGGGGGAIEPYMLLMLGLTLFGRTGQRVIICGVRPSKASSSGSHYQASR